MSHNESGPAPAGRGWSARPGYRSAKWGHCRSCGDPLHESESKKGNLCNVCRKWGARKWHEEHKYPSRRTK